MNQNLRSATSISELLKLEFADRNEKNPAYSMRAFARDLGLSKSHLGDVVNGRGGLSRAFAKVVAQALRYSKKELEFLFALIEKDFGRSTSSREASLTKLESLNRGPHYEVLSEERFKIVSDWYHFAILEMTLLQDFELDFQKIGRRLGIKPLIAQTAVERMLSLGIAEMKDGKLTASEIITTGNDMPSTAIRSFHRQLIEKSLHAIDDQSVSERLLSTHLNAVRACDLQRARERILNFANAFNEEFGGSEEKDSLYALSIQFFNLQKN